MQHIRLQRRNSMVFNQRIFGTKPQKATYYISNILKNSCQKKEGYKQSF
jgi:hypothetical protein